MQKLLGDTFLPPPRSRNERSPTIESKTPTEELAALTLHPKNSPPPFQRDSYSFSRHSESNPLTQVAVTAPNSSSRPQSMSLTPEFFANTLSLSSSTRHAPEAYMNTPRNTPRPVSATRHFNFEPPAQLWGQLHQKTIDLFNDKLVRVVSYSSKTHRFSDIDSPQTSAIFINAQFLHANYVQVKNGPLLIAAQYPYESESARELFWKCALEHGSIIDLAQSNEPEVTPYYPLKEGKSERYGNVQVICTSIRPLHQDMSDISYSVYDVTDFAEHTPQTKQIARIHYFGWKDHTHASLDRLSLLVEYLEQHPFEQQIIHCRAGVGRTGTLITACNLKKKILNREISRENLQDSVINLTAESRLMRGPKFVQKKEQLYQLIEYGLQILQELEEKDRLNPQTLQTTDILPKTSLS